MLSIQWQLGSVICQWVSQVGRRLPAMRRRWHILPGGPVKAGKSHSHLLARAMGAVNTGHLADDDPDDST